MTGWALAAVARPEDIAMNRQRIEAIAIVVAVTMSISCAPKVSAQNAAAPFQIVETSIEDVHAAFKSGRLTVHQLVQGYLDRIDAYDKRGPGINSIITLNPQALEDADRLDAAFKAGGLVGPLHGIPVWSRTR